MQLIAKILGGVVLVALLVLSTIFVLSTNKLAKGIVYVDSSPGIPKDSASLARGRHLARAIGKCADCHGDDLSGQVIIDALPMARVVAPNLTSGRGGIGGQRTDDQLIQAVRHGVGMGGRPLALMPARNYWHMSDDDVGALVGYLRSLPAVDKELPPTTFGLVGRTLLVRGTLNPMFEALDMDHDARRDAPPAADTTQAYGQYLANIGGCTGCHGPGLSGGAIPGMPPDAKPAANITPEGIGRWSEQDFFVALREGRRPDGTALDSTVMPVRFTREMSDLETRAVWMYLQTVPPRAFGSR
jgi:mono/diheme cytochrome c family protein